MSARRFALLAALAFAIMFAASNLIANSWLRSWRLDLTEDRLYTLSEGTRRTLDDLSEPVELTLYYSRDAAALRPDLQAYAARVREMLQSFQSRSRGRIRFVEVDVEPVSEEEDAAVEQGLQAFRPFEGADPIYLGLTGANAIDDRRGIPFFDPQREPFLEYEITRLIFELENPEPTRVALITSLPLDPQLAAIPQFASPARVFADELGRLLEVEVLAGDFQQIPDVDVLAIIHPGDLNLGQLYAIDQFILRKGRAFIALDPASLMALQGGGGNPFAPTPQASPSSSQALAPLFERWGVTMTAAVVMDREGALPVPVEGPDGQQTQAPQPLFFVVPADEGLDRDDLMTAWLNRGINFGLAGGLSASARDGVTTHALVRTSGETARMPASQAMAAPSPYDIFATWQSAGRRETIALRLSGSLETAFPDGRPPAPPPVEGEPAPPAPEVAEPLTRSATPAELVIVADTDFLADDFYVDPRNNTAAADNGSFALNAIDVLGGSDALVSLRSRASTPRRLDVVEDMEREAIANIRNRQQQLQADLEQTEAQLAELQARGQGSGFLSGNANAELTEDENAAIERFRRRVIEVRGELRGVERNLRGDIDRLQALVAFINVWMAPLAVALGGLFLFWRSQRRGGARR